MIGSPNDDGADRSLLVSYPSEGSNGAQSYRRDDNTGRGIRLTVYWIFLSFTFSFLYLVQFASHSRPPVVPRVLSDDRESVDYRDSSFCK